MALGGAAFAAISDSSGVIHGYYDSGGNLKVVSQTCAKGFTPLDWNQAGPKGDTGAQGPAGPQGPVSRLICCAPLAVLLSSVRKGSRSTGRPPRASR